MRLITVEELQRLIRMEGVEAFLRRAIVALDADFRLWHRFHQSPRHALHYPFGVLELMPCADELFYTVKYVNGHPGNPAEGKLSVTALGMLADVATGYPLMVSEMTLLTAMRTAATGALAARLLARPDSHCLALIGTGAQAEFQVLALREILPITTVRYFDHDREAMAKFAGHLRARVELQPCASIDEALDGADVWVTATAAKEKKALITPEMLRPGVHINAMGGDCPGKTELDPAVLDHARVVVEYIEQSLVEGEIQNAGSEQIDAELWELVGGEKPGRQHNKDITLFDGVGIGLEDFSILKLVYHLAYEEGIGEEVDMIPVLDDPKDLYALVAPEPLL